MRETLLELSHGLGEPEQDLRVVSHQAPNDALNDMVLTSGYAEDLENPLMEVWGQRGRRGERSRCYKLVAAACGLWTVDNTTRISEAHAVSV